MSAIKQIAPSSFFTDFDTVKEALKMRCDEMKHVANALAERRSEHAEYAANKYIDALKCYDAFGEWDGIF
jgi:hypothetical protein